MQQFIDEHLAFILISAGLFWLSMIICFLVFFFGIRNAQTEPPDTQIYEKEKSRRNEPMTLERLLDGEKEAALINWKNPEKHEDWYLCWEDSVIIFKDLEQIDEI